MKTQSLSIILSVVVILVLIGGGFYAWRQSKGDEWKTYRDEVNRFSFEYPQDFIASNATISLYPLGQIQGVKVSRNLPIQYCGESGLPEHCRAFTENPGVSFSVVGGSLEEIISPVRQNLQDLVRQTELAGRRGYVVELGAEGEGIFTYYLPLGADTTLVITRNYIDENTLMMFREYPDFLSLEEQRELFERIASTIIFER